MTEPIIVVGAGMIGAATARHLAEAGESVTVVGPPEPAVWGEHDGPFASHYDQGRITRVVANDPVWAALAARSIDRYADIEARSGIGFHVPRGLAWLGHDLAAEIAAAGDLGSDCRRVDPEWIDAHTGIRVPDIAGLECAYEGPPAGHVNPRRLVAAELALARSAGASHVPAAVDSVGATSDGAVVRGRFGEIAGRAALLATGASGAAMAGVALDLRPVLRTIVRADVGPLPELPSLICAAVPDDRLDGIYWVPPVRYPNGRTLLKIGGQMHAAEITTDTDRIRRWFGTDGDPEETAALVASIRALLPERRIESRDSRPCVVTNTASGRPYIGWIDERIAVAVGGCGAAAKSCDEIGRTAAGLFSEGGWLADAVAPAETFAPILE